MGLAVSEEEIMLEEAANSFLSGDNGIPRYRMLRDSQITTDRDCWASIKDMGWTALIIEEKFGGADLAIRAGCSIAESIGQNLSLIPFISSALLSPLAISQMGSQKQQRDWLPQLSTGEEITALAIIRPDEASIELQPHKDGFRIVQQKIKAVDAMAADSILILGENQNQEQFICRIPLNQEGISRTQLSSIDGRDFADISISNIIVSTSDILGGQTIAEEALNELRAHGALIYAAELLGCARTAFDMTLAYIKERSQFGKTLGSFQALQHRMAIMYSELLLTEALIIKTAGLLENNDQDAVRYCSLAKAKAGQSARLITNEAIQLHGGIGMTDEYDVGFFIKRVAVSERLYGDYNFHADNAARLLGY